MNMRPLATAAPSQVYQQYRHKVLQLHNKHAEIVNAEDVVQQAASLPDLEQDRKDWQYDLAASRLIFLGQTGLGKTTTLETLLTLTREMYPQVSDRMESEAVLAALGSRTWQAATEAEVQYVPAPSGLARDDPNFEAIQKSQQAYLVPPSDLLSARRPKPLLSMTANPVGSTTSSNTLWRFGQTLGALEKFKSVDTLQHIAHDCLVQLAELPPAEERSVEQVQQSYRLTERFEAITGQAADCVDYATPSAVVLAEAVQKIAGTVRLYSGHGQPFGGYRDFLSKALIQNQPKSPVLIALDHTQLFFPSEILRVPFGDTVGSGDTSPLNADATQQAVDEAIDTSSQLVLFAGKSLVTEATLTPYLIAYCKHMLETDSSRPAVHCVLMPGPEHPYTPASLPLQQDVDKQRQEESISQFSICLRVANASLTSDQQASPEKLQQLVQERFTVHPVYLRTFAALCQVPAAKLEEFAEETKSNPQELLEATNGPWLLGLSTQLTAELSQRFMQRLDTVHLQQIINMADGEISDNSTTLPLHVQSALAQSIKQHRADLRMRGEDAPDLSDMQDMTEEALTVLQSKISEAFEEFVASVQQQYRGMRSSIQEEWKAKFAQATPSDQRTMVVYRTEGGLNRTTAFNLTFGKITLPSGWTQQLQAKLQPIVKKFFQEELMQVLEEKTVTLLAACAPGQDIYPLVQKAMRIKVETPLAGIAERLIHQLLKESSVKTCFREMHVAAAKEHLVTGSCASHTVEGCQQEIEDRVDATLEAAEHALSNTIKAHVQDHTGRLLETLFPDTERRYRGRALRLLLDLLDQVNAVARRADQSVEEQRAMNESMQQIKEEALTLRDQIRKECEVMMQTATIPDRKGGGLASAVHRRARMTSQLQQKLASAGNWQQMQTGSTLTFVTNPRLSKDIGQHVWSNISKDPIPLSTGTRIPGSLAASSSDSSLLNLGSALPGYALPALTDSEWAAFSKSSLPATVQHLLWPDLQGEDAARKHEQLTAAVAFQLDGDWDAMQAWPALREVHLSADDGSSLGLEDYVQQILTGENLGVLELVMLMRMLKAACKDMPSVVFQIWQAEALTPVQLFYEADDVEADDVEARPVTYNVFLAMLPQSNKPVWLPLVEQTTSASNVEDTWWSDRLEALDAKLTRRDTSSNAEQAPARNPFRRRPPARGYKPPTTRRRGAQPAESSGSVFHRTKRGPSPDHESSKGKAPRTD